MARHPSQTWASSFLTSFVRSVRWKWLSRSVGAIVPGCFTYPILSNAASTPKLSLGGYYWLKALVLPGFVDAPNVIEHRSHDKANLARIGLWVYDGTFGLAAE
jgi:hypothetical protein